MTEHVIKQNLPINFAANQRVTLELAKSSGNAGFTMDLDQIEGKLCRVQATIDLHYSPGCPLMSKLNDALANVAAYLDLKKEAETCKDLAIPHMMQRILNGEDAIRVMQDSIYFEAPFVPGAVV